MKVNLLIGLTAIALGAPSAPAYHAPSNELLDGLRSASTLCFVSGLYHAAMALDPRDCPSMRAVETAEKWLKRRYKVKPGEMGETYVVYLSGTTADAWIGVGYNGRSFEDSPVALVRVGSSWRTHAHELVHRYLDETGGDLDACHAAGEYPAFTRREGC